MTEQRAPQEHARELAIEEALPCNCGRFKASGKHHWDCAASYHPAVRALIAAHTASQLAGAVPQEELRALIEKWRTSYWAYAHLGTGQATEDICADELESLIDKRR